MAFFEDLGKKITHTSQGVVQKTKDTAEIIKLNGFISDEEKRIDAWLLEIGKVYVETKGNNPESQFSDLVMSVKQAKERIEEYAEQVKKLKGIVRCTKCDGEVAYNAPFCSSCGAPMATQSTPLNNSNVIHCVKCGASINKDMKFCTSCGTPVAGVTSVEAKIVDSKPIENEIPAKEEQVIITPKCTNCGAELVDDVVFCTECGTKRES